MNRDSEKVITFIWLAPLFVIIGICALGMMAESAQGYKSPQQLKCSMWNNAASH